ncbi:MAG: glycosyltransferase family 2 protein [Tepidisphaera sp.]|jgi:glycosyltransferase involved in cell wall biosynthesis
MPSLTPQIRPPYNGPRPPVSVVILTLDEEINMADCLASCVWCDDVHVLDSGSKDKTAELARAGGAAVHFNPFKSFGAQRNWAIDNIPLKHDWVFHLDADERFTVPIVKEIARVVESSPSEAGYYVANEMVFMGSWIKRASGYPAHQMRLFHKARMRFSDHGHGQREDTTGKLGTLKEPYVHHNFSKGLDDWFERHNRYSRREADLIIANEGERVGLGGLFSGDKIVRRRTLKAIASRVPMRAQLRWLHTVLVKGAWLDGRAGMRYATLLSVYERMIALKVAEKRSKQPRGGA